MLLQRVFWLALTSFLVSTGRTQNHQLYEVEVFDLSAFDSLNSVRSCATSLLNLSARYAVNKQLTLWLRHSGPACAPDGALRRSAQYPDGVLRFFSDPIWCLTA
jgi:hypothetical protein